jgi:hypothetical protein
VEKLTIQSRIDAFEALKMVEAIFIAYTEEISRWRRRRTRSTTQRKRSYCP